MAKIIPSNNGLILDQASVIYDPETETVKIYCEDEELPAGFVLGVQKNGRVEKNLLNLLKNHNQIPVEEEIIYEDEYVVYSDEPDLEPDYTFNAEDLEIDPTLPVNTSPEHPSQPTTSPAAIMQDEPAMEVYVVDEPSKHVMEPVGAIPHLDLTQKGNIISFMSPQERAGKTTGAVMLASALVRTPTVNSLPGKEKVVIVDLDFKNQSVSSLTNAYSGGLLGTYATGKVTTETVLNNLVFNKDLGIHVLPVGTMFENPENYVGEEFIQHVVESLKPVFNLIIMDVPTQDVTHITPWLVDKSDILVLGSVYDRGTTYVLRDWLKSHIKYQKTVAKLTVLVFAAPKLRMVASLNDVKNTFKPLSIVGNIPTDTAGFLGIVKNNTLVNAFTTHNMVADAYSVIAERFITVPTPSFHQ